MRIKWDNRKHPATNLNPEHILSVFPSMKISGEAKMTGSITMFRMTEECGCFFLDSDTDGDEFLGYIHFEED